ncbi:MAG: hypothetical protein Q8P46_07040 [Hyphomicrobiales bacterium]|nr:hypothetical protein [Hyphomicrobiales bacterium]
MSGFCVVMILGTGLLCSAPPDTSSPDSYCAVMEAKLQQAPRDFQKASPAVKRWLADQIKTFDRLCR